MKKTMVVMAMVAAIVSCGGNDTKPAVAENKTADITQNPDYKKGLDLVAKAIASPVIKVAEASTGPAYTAVAKKYAGQPGVEDMLAQKVIKGGAGNWGTIPMTPHPQISEDDAKAMVKYVLTLNQ